MNRTLILLTLFSLFSSINLKAENVRVTLDGIDEPVNCSLINENYFCENGDDYLYGMSFGMDLSLTGVVEGDLDQFRVTRAESVDNPGVVLFESSEEEYNPFFYNLKPTTAVSETYLQDLLKLKIMKRFLEPYPEEIEQSEEIREYKERLLSRVNQSLEVINNDFKSPSRNIELDNGDKLKCEQAPSNGTGIQCTLYECSSEDSSEDFLYITNPNASYGINYVFSINDKGLLEEEVISSVGIEGNSKLVIESIKFEHDQYSSSDYQDDQSFSQINQLMGIPQYQAPEFNYEELMPSFDNEETTKAFHSIIGMGGEAIIEESLAGCDQSRYRPIMDATNKMREDIVNRNYVQYISDFNNGLIGYYLGVENLPEGACLEDGVYYNPETYRSARNVDASEASQVQTITIEEAHKLFDMAKDMDDIAWGYKADGCYARAHLMARRFEAMGYQVDKAWLKGSLRAQGGEGEQDTLWNFHVAPVVYVEGENGQVERVVIDPSIEDGPVSANQWAGNLSDDVDGRVITTAFPYPDNSAATLRNSLAFSNSDPYLPVENRDMSEQSKMEMAVATMLEYKGYEN